jgi:hypothetical protein
LFVQLRELGLYPGKLVFVIAKYRIINVTALALDGGSFGSGKIGLKSYGIDKFRLAMQNTKIIMRKRRVVQ